MERKIIWLDNPLEYPYLREGTYVTTSPKVFPVKRFLKNGMRVIGYEIHNKERGEHPKVYSRRYWFLKPHDRDLNPNGVYKYLAPAEAVVPSSIQENQESIEYKQSELFQNDMKRYEESEDYRSR